MSETGRLADTVTTTDVEHWVQALAAATGPDEQPERIDLLRALERLTCAAAGLQAQVTADFAAEQRRAAADAGVARERRDRGIASQIALARRESPHRGGIHLGLATALAAELPHTLGALRGGWITEWRATQIARETACLSIEDRAEIDRKLASDPERLEKMSDNDTVASARQMAYQADKQVWVRRKAKAHTERRVSIRPAPDTMAYVTALLPMAEGVACHAALAAAAASATATGDERTRGQIMADTLVARIIAAAIDDTAAPVSPVRVHLTVSDRTLFGSRDETAHVRGYGPIPADVARELVHAAATSGVAELRRVYTRPDTGAVVAMDRNTRLFPASLAELIRLRDPVCRTPWCDAPVRHIDHIHPAADGGPTTLENGQGLCEACNYAKQAPGWVAESINSPDGRHRVRITTPTGHTHHSLAPPAPRPAVA
ncbi:HNH endonuclease [Rhodococcus sp. ABRD24]|uniref:HNH endonuclease n=1 Tax=Rhodococcus sp. ABRD24 TaxID=2507582 RepID=UPI0010392752|nr:HNH endonuclease signature motif containing protein [Rhodococcus sp. ABRD24]QBJ97695.1 HNH endonuclease [Rhodococcus sp. ABRD24]